MNVSKLARQMKHEAPCMAASTEKQRNDALALIAQALEASQDEIFAANAQDLHAAEDAALPKTTQKRLRYDAHKMQESLAQLKGLRALPDPIGVRTLHRELAPGLTLTRMSCPIGVIGVIFEARPDALVQVASLCIKSGNCAILKGGKETTNTNRVLFELVHTAATSAGLPPAALALVESHAEIDELLSCYDAVDLLIPRGSNAFVQYIMDHTKIPVMGHSSGVCHIYVDKDADLDLAAKVVVDAKTQYPAVCNATETLLVHQDIAAAFVPRVIAALGEKGARLRGTQDVVALAPASSVELMDESEFGTEYGDYILSSRVVPDVAAAVAHINRWGSHHTDCIITKNDETSAYFMQMVDSAGVYQNCSTRFADGFRYGFGAEVGISTGKLHARGPVGLEGLETYKYQLVGHGDIVADFAEGRRSFAFKDLDD
ncbi:MAG: glutamate-5-semialdehyde dehydrogenase [Atopobiaceae bacterium]|jgi:glutamate-5-semialdehyde dehydrogenase